MKTIKQIKNLKSYKESEFKVIRVWTAKLINGNWNYGWYDLEEIESNINNFNCKIEDKFEYTIE